MTSPAPAPEPDLPHRLLLAEDDPRLATAFARRLEMSGFAVDVVRSLGEARDHEQQRDYACLVLDRLLPDGDVLDLVRELDERDRHPPIVLVSAIADEEDRVAGLRAGVDDYVAKPVHLDELAVRVARLVGVAAQAVPLGEPPLELGPVHLDPVRLRVHLGDEPLVLPVPQLIILRTLILHSHRAVATSELLDACDRCEVGSISTGELVRHIEALEQALAGHLVIERAPRRSYRISTGPRPSIARVPRRLVFRAGRRGRPDTVS